MSPTDVATDAARFPVSWMAGLHRALRPPVHSVRFWLVQVAVVAIAGLHDVLLVWLRAREGTLAVPGPVTSALMFIPVLYAALNFGLQGAVGTALLSTVLIIPHWLLTNPLTSTHVWVETGNLIVLNTVAVFVGARVERERLSREHAERALAVAELATTRYHTLFGDHPSAVIITDADGAVLETNAAATRLLGEGTIGMPIDALLGESVSSLISGIPGLRLVTSTGEEQFFVPTAHLIHPDSATRLVQVCLVDVTDQHRRQEEQRQFGARLLAVQEDERRRLARDLHDDPLQTLMFLARALDDMAGDPRLPGDVAERIRGDAGLATDVGQVLRKVIRGLRPPVLDDLGLVSALRQLIDVAKTRPGAPTIRLRVEGDPVRLSPQTELAAYRLVQESLSNVLRHADAGQVDVHLTFSEELTLSVADNGLGIEHHRRRDVDTQPRATAGSIADDAQELQAPGVSGLGLVGLRERVAALGGRIEVREREPKGTIVRATLPGVSGGG